MNVRIVGAIEAVLVAAVFLIAPVARALMSTPAHGPQPAVTALAPAGRDYIVTGAKPNLLFVVDPEARKVVHRYVIPGDGPPFTIAASPDGKRAYVLTDHMNSISGIDLDTGKQVFRAELSSAGELVRSLGGIAVSRDGKELFVQESPAKLLPSEYVVEPARIAVYRTDGGLNAGPVRSFEVPRRIIMMMPSADGKILYALGWDLYALDPQNGHIIGTQKILHWDRSNASPPDILDVWPLFEQSDVFSTPYFYTRTDKKPGSPGFARTGLLTLDLKTGVMTMKDFEDTSVVIFSTVVDPADRSNIYGVYATLSKIDNGRAKLVARVDAAHTYYAINISADGKHLYLGGAMGDIAIYSAADLHEIGDIELPGGGDMAGAAFRMIHR